MQRSRKKVETFEGYDNSDKTVIYVISEKVDGDPLVKNVLAVLLIYSPLGKLCPPAARQI